MFSIIIPLYNKASYISKAIDSILSQIFQDFELIIVNDGSTDDSLQKINEYSDHRLTIINQSNNGVSAARNNGAKYAKFDFLAFLDADDWWDNHFLEEMAKLIHHSPQAKLYGSSYYIVKYGKNKLPVIGLDSDFKTGYIDYFKVYSRTFWVPFNCSFVVVQKRTFESEGGFNQAIKFGEDFDLWARIALKEKVAYINRPLAYSNQDVDTHNRALGEDKLWKKEEHITFNLSHLETNQQKNVSLTHLLDGLKVRSLIIYYLNGPYCDEANRILKTINWECQPFLYRFIYNWPKWVVVLFFSIKSYGSKLKSFTLSELHKYNNP